MNDSAGGGGGLAPRQVALIGRRMLQTLVPTGTPTVTVFATTWGRAETILLGASPQRSRADRTAAELIIGRGRLRRRGRPVGRALLGLTIWIPNGARSDSGVLRRVPKQLAELGPGSTYNLTLQQPASAAVAVRPLRESARSRSASRAQHCNRRSARGWRTPAARTSTHSAPPSSISVLRTAGPRTWFSVTPTRCSTASRFAPAIERSPSTCTAGRQVQCTGEGPDA